MALIRTLGQDRIAVKAERVAGRYPTYRVTDDICVIGASTRVFERPWAKIVDDDGNEIQPTGRFLWSAETIDPYHLVIDMF